MCLEDTPIFLGVCIILNRHFLSALPLSKCSTTELSTVEAQTFYFKGVTAVLCSLIKHAIIRSFKILVRAVQLIPLANETTAVNWTSAELSVSSDFRKKNRSRQKFAYLIL